jgi:predicted acyltransferase
MVELKLFKNILYITLGCKPPFDPENLLGIIPTTFLAYLGVQAGRILGLNIFIRRFIY